MWLCEGCGWVVAAPPGIERQFEHGTGRGDVLLRKRVSARWADSPTHNMR